MPELPEVETIRRELEPWLTHRTILSATRVDAPAGPKYANLGRAAGQRVLAVRRRGKFLLLPLSGGDELVIHLGMTGVITATPAKRHVRVRLGLEHPDRPWLHFVDPRRFGRFLVIAAGAYETLPTLHNMGLEPFDEAFTDGRFYDALQRSSTAVKTYLLSQRPVSGVGNIYADEALWLARLHPLTPACRVSRQKAGCLRAALRDVLQASITAQGTTLNDYRTVNGEVGAYLAQLHAYGHAGRPCERCATLLVRLVVAGRSSHYCPHCQRLPAARPVKHDKHNGKSTKEQRS